MSLCIEILWMWNIKCMIIPVIIGATRIVTKGLKKYLKAVPGKHWIDSLQKMALLGTSHITEKVLQSETWILSDGDHHWFKRILGRKGCDKRCNNNDDDDDDDNDDDDNDDGDNSNNDRVQSLQFLRLLKS